MAIVYYPDGSTRDVSHLTFDACVRIISNGADRAAFLTTYPCLSDRRKAVICDEEGLIHGLALNLDASRAAGFNLVGVVIVGDRKEIRSALSK